MPALVPAGRRKPARARPLRPRRSDPRARAREAAAPYRSRPLREAPSYARALRATLLALSLGALVLSARVAQLTVLRHGESLAAALDNVESVRRLEAPRGNIRDAHGEPVALNRKAYSLTFSRQGLSDERATDLLRSLSELMGEDFAARAPEILATRPTWTRHSLARRLPEGAVTAILERPADFPGVRVSPDFIREYPFGPALAPVVGYVGKIPPSQTERFTRPLYLPDAFVGRGGVERHHEEALVGQPGRERRTLDARGRLLDEPMIEVAARPGSDLHLTIDAGLQARAHELLAGQRGTMILMDARTGDLVVMASRPAFDPSAPWLQEVDGEPVSFLNHAHQGTYPPASTFKPVVATAFLRAGVLPTDTIDSPGYFMLPGWNYRWRCSSGFTGPTSLSDALKFSSNVYFYANAHELGGASVLAAARSFGYGQPTGVDLPGERAGSLGRTDDPGPGETLNLAIGQGALLATPLQVARAIAAIANGGDLVRPRVVGAVAEPGRLPRPVAPVIDARVPLAPGHRAAILEGMRRVVNEVGGTAHKAHFPREWDIFGKTGTAENGRGGIDAWFVGGFPASAPTHVVLCHLEDTKEGGGVEAAPLARQLLEAYFSPAVDEQPPLVAAAEAALD